MGLTKFPNGIQTPVTGSTRHWLPNGAEVWFVGETNASDDNRGNDYDRPLARISKATVDKVPSSAGSANGRGDIIMVAPGRYAENVRIIDRDRTRIVGSGVGLSTVVPGDTVSTQDADNEGQSQTITLTNQTTEMTDWAFIVGSRGVSIEGFMILATGNAAGAIGGIYIGDGGVINSANNWGSSQFSISDIFMDGEGGFAGGWGMVWDGFGPGGVVENVRITRFRSGGLLVGGGTGRNTIGGIFRYNHIYGCRGYGIRRSVITGAAGLRGVGLNQYIVNTIADGDGTAFTNAILLGINPTHADHVIGNHLLTSATAISATATDRLSGNYTSAGADSPTYVSMA